MKGKSDARCLYLDFDGKAPIGVCELRRRLAFVGVPVRFLRYDRTNRGWHVIIACACKFSPLDCVALQFMLGSDRERETFNLARVMWSGREGRKLGNRWNILYERKVEK